MANTVSLLKGPRLASALGLVLLLVSAPSALVAQEASELKQTGWDNWQTLARVDYNEQYVEKVGGNILFPVFPQSIKALEGKEILLSGYIIPLNELGGESSDYFMFSSRPYNSCYFCGGAGPESVAAVYPSGRVPNTEEPVTIRGRLVLNEKDYDQLMYQLKEARIVVK
jgi:hypothetical protein